MHFDAEFYVTVGSILFLALLFYMGVHKTVLGGLDARGQKIAGELAEAKRLREEAEAILASFKKKAVEAEAEAAGIVKQAIAEGEAHAKEAAARLAEFVTRRTKQAESKLAQAEAQATADVRAAAADAAVKAAEYVLKAETTGKAAVDLISQEIAGLKARLN